MKFAREIFILIGRNKIHTRANRCLPSNARRFERSEIVRVEPAMRTLIFERLAIDGVETNPQSALMRVSYERLQTLFLLCVPLAGSRLSRRLNHAPRIVP